jgi:hypothetical protein
MPLIKIFIPIWFTVFLFSCSESPQVSDKQNDSFTGTTQRIEKKAEQQGSSVLIAVRTGSHSGYDRIVFEFNATLPSYEVDYISRPYHQCGSGEEVTMQGAEIVQVRFSVAQAHDDAGRATIGKVSVPPGFAMKEVRLVCDFEGEVTFLIGMKGKIQYRVDEMKNPARMVLDIQRN